MLEDGSRFDGDAFHAHGRAGGAAPGVGEALGEAVFNTSHSGYQEILTDPSYLGQIMVFTAPHIGNVGTNDDDLESERVQAAGAVVRALSPRPSSWRSRTALAERMERDGVPLLSGVDTRAVTLHLRGRGAMRAGLFSASIDERDALYRVRMSRSMAGADLATAAGSGPRRELGPDDAAPGGRFRPPGVRGDGLRVAVLDYGVKRSILDELLRRGCRVSVLPAATPAAEVTAGGFDGVVLSNGPGDPAATEVPLATVRALLPWSIAGARPLFGICLGHQLLALAAGMETFKLPFGHRGANHPVRREADRVVEITSQNHGFAVKPERLAPGFVLTHVNLNDGTVEGLAHRDAPVFSIQYHPEASPGPLDGLGYFDRFVQLMGARR
jgi:carbamoyl-phosphate synthase small subunit